jgi:hypothetical protein
MSYMNMDHAAWCESNNAAGRRTSKPKKIDGQLVGYHAAPPKLTQFQARVMDMLGIICGGIYNAGISWETVEWDYGGSLSVVIAGGNGWSTFDFSRLTSFVLLCHTARIRGDISPAGPGRYRLSFWQRTAIGGMNRRHPDLGEAVAAFENELPAASHIRWRGEYDAPVWDDIVDRVIESYGRDDAVIPYGVRQLIANAAMDGGSYGVYKAIFEAHGISKTATTEASAVHKS